MLIGEVARQLGISADTLRFYERSGVLPRSVRRDNGYREYSPSDVERLRLLLDLRRFDLPLEDAARLAGWCQTGHCAETTTELPRLIAAKRAAIRERIAGLRRLDARLAQLERHLEQSGLPILGGVEPCCGAAAAAEAVAEGAAVARDPVRRSCGSGASRE